MALNDTAVFFCNTTQPAKWVIDDGTSNMTIYPSNDKPVPQELSDRGFESESTYYEPSEFINKLFVLGSMQNNQTIINCRLKIDHTQLVESFIMTVIGIITLSYIILIM